MRELLRLHRIRMAVLPKAGGIGMPVMEDNLRSLNRPRTHLGTADTAPGSHPNPRLFSASGSQR